MMFSDDQLNTKMDIGFVGSPNIGSVALNEFKDSEEFRQFSNVFQKNDRIFVVSSIFGGTGAAGYPIIVKNIRNAGNNAQINNRGNLRDARIGALTVLPYFNVQQDENSPISRADFISKTKSALFYYHDNLTGLKRNGVDIPMSKINAWETKFPLIRISMIPVVMGSAMMPMWWSLWVHWPYSTSFPCPTSSCKLLMATR